MSNLSQLLQYDYLGRKEKAIDPNRLAQIAKVNALSQVFNLFGQASMGTKGATITPQKDIITPYVLNEFTREREREITQNIQDRQILLRELLRQEREQERLDTQKQLQDERLGAEETRRQEQNKFTEQQTKERQAWTEKQKKEQEAREISDYQKKRNIDVDYRKRISGIEKEEGKGEEKEQWFIESTGQGLTSREFNNMKLYARGILQKPEIRQRLTDAGKYELANAKGLSNDEWLELFNELWDELEPYYKNVHKWATEGETSPIQKAKPKAGMFDDLAKSIITPQEAGKKEKITW